MASKGTEIGLVLVPVGMLWNGAAAQSGCTRALIGLSPCLNFVMETRQHHHLLAAHSSTVSLNPSHAAFAHCSTGASLGITMSQTLALSLPGACNVQTPSVSQCNAAANGPTASAITPSAQVGPPADSPTADSPIETPEIHQNRILLQQKQVLKQSLQQMVPHLV